MTSTRPVFMIHISSPAVLPCQSRWWLPAPSDIVDTSIIQPVEITNRESKAKSKAQKESNKSINHGSEHSAIPTSMVSPALTSAVKCTEGIAACTYMSSSNSSSSCRCSFIRDCRLWSFAASCVWRVFFARLRGPFLEGVSILPRLSRIDAEK